MKKFVVVGTQRTGTTLIRTTLNSHPQVTCTGEVFKVPGWYVDRVSRRIIRRTAFQDPSSYSAWTEKSLLRRLGHYAWRARNTREYLDQFYSDQSSEAKGFKVMYNQTQRFPAVIPYIRDHQISVIHVVRENFLKTLVSRIVAEQRNLYHARQGSDAPRKAIKVTVPADRLIGELQRIKLHTNRWQELFGDTPHYLRVVYESFSRNKEKEGAEMLAFLGLGSSAMSSSLVKINSDSLVDVIENYSEVESLLRGTEFELCLD